MSDREAVNKELSEVENKVRARNQKEESGDKLPFDKMKAAIVQDQNELEAQLKVDKTLSKYVENDVFGQHAELAAQEDHNLRVMAASFQPFDVQAVVQQQELHPQVASVGNPAAATFKDAFTEATSSS